MTPFELFEVAIASINLYLLEKSCETLNCKKMEKLIDEENLPKAGRELH